MKNTTDTTPADSLKNDAKSVAVGLAVLAGIVGVILLLGYVHQQWLGYPEGGLLFAGLVAVLEIFVVSAGVCCLLFGGFIVGLPVREWFAARRKASPDAAGDAQTRIEE